MRLIVHVSVLLLTAGCVSQRDDRDRSGEMTYALVGGIVYPAADADPIINGVVVTRGSRVAAVGTREGVAIPAAATVLNVTGYTIVPGFWNSHVHFIEPKWAGIDTIPAMRLSTQLRDMFTQFGFVRVFET